MNTQSNGNSKVSLLNNVVDGPTTDAPVASSSPSRLEQNLHPRNRSASNDSIARQIAYSHPVTGEADLDNMRLAKFLDQVEENDPLLAHHLRSTQDRVRSAFLRAQDVRREIDEERLELRQRSVDLDEKVDATLVEIEKKRQQVLAEPATAAKEAEKALGEAHEEACAAYEQVGAVYHPGEATESEVIRVSRLSRSEASAQLKVPIGETIKQVAFLPKLVSWAGTVISGVVFGISLGLAGGLIQSGDVFTHPKIKPILTLAIIGVFLACLSRGWLRLSWHQFAEQNWLGATRRRQWSWFLAALLSTVLVAAILLCTDSQGLLRAALARAAFDKHGSTGGIVLWVVAAAASMFSIGYSTFEGLATGREDAAESVLTNHIEGNFRVREEERRSMPTVCNALGALSRAIEGIRRHHMAVTVVANLNEQFDALVQKAEAQRIEYAFEHTETMKRRHEDSLHNLEGVQIELDALISDFLVGRQNGVANKRSKR